MRPFCINLSSRRDTSSTVSVAAIVVANARPRVASKTERGRRERFYDYSYISPSFIRTVNVNGKWHLLVSVSMRQRRGTRGAQYNDENGRSQVR